MSRLSPEQTTRSPVLNRASAERSPTPSVQERAKAILQQPARDRKNHKLSWVTYEGSHSDREKGFGDRGGPAPASRMANERGL